MALCRREVHMQFTVSNNVILLHIELGNHFLQELFIYIDILILMFSHQHIQDFLSNNVINSVLFSSTKLSFFVF